LKNTGGIQHTAVGIAALSNNTSGNFNIAIGGNAGASVTTASNVICIDSVGVDVSGTCYICNIRGVQTQNGNTLPVLIDSSGQLGTASSSLRYKDNIKPMGNSSEAILALKLVAFHYKGDKTNTPQFGLVADVNPNLVVRDEKGDIYTVRYDAVNAMVLNEFLKEHRKVQAQDRKIEEQETTIARLKQDFQSRVAEQQKQIEALTEGLQKVSEQVEVSRTAAQTVMNNR
jgi:hypothetical protein